uniref:Uncharacterized protein n=1 Tax=Avena sativa TaxID=4498 RepID=A0ACD5T6T2_AVESA
MEMRWCANETLWGIVGICFWGALKRDYWLPQCFPTTASDENFFPDIGSLYIDDRADAAAATAVATAAAAAALPAEYHDSICLAGQRIEARYSSSILSHLQYRCPSCPFTDHEKRRKLSLQNDHRFSNEDCRRALAKMIILDEYPFSAVEGEGFRAYSKTLQPQFEPPSRYTVARDCMNLYLEEKAKLKDILRDQRVCLTTDTWTSIQNQNYMSLTVHWINSRWELERKVLNFCFVPDHAGDTLGRMVEECLLEWEIGQVFTMTVDNATSNNTVVQYLKTVTKHWQSTVSNNEFFRVRCCCHIVNLVVKKGWEGSNPSVARIRTALLFAKSSPGRLRLFRKCVMKEKIVEKSLFSLDVDTRWNSTYLMLNDTIPFEKAFKRLGDECKYYTPYFSKVRGPPTVENWLEARKLISVFKFFYNVTLRFSGQQYVTSTTFFHDFLLMHNKITQLIHGKEQEAGLASMAENMKQKFDKYWDNNDGLNPLLFIAVVLDPRYKLKFLEFCFSNIYDQDKAKNFTKKVEDGLRRLFEWYVEAESAATKDVLAVPVSTIASEASFSTGRRVINPQRSSLSSKMVEALICGQSWLRSSPNKIDIRQTIADLHKYEELAQELGVPLVLAKRKMSTWDHHTVLQVRELSSISLVSSSTILMRIHIFVLYM